MNKYLINTVPILVACFISIANAETNSLFFTNLTPDSSTNSQSGLTTTEKIGAASLVVGGLVGTALLISKSRKDHEGALFPHILKIADLNAANYDDHEHWDQRLKLIARDIDNSGANIITLQEVGYNPTKKPNMAKQILKQLKIMDPKRFKNATTIINAAIRKENSQYGRWEGLAIIYPQDYSLKMISNGSFPLTIFFPPNGIPACNEESDIRVIQYAKFEYQGHPFYIFNGHFAARHEDCRHENANEAIRAMQEIADEDPHVPQFLVGDFNATDNCSKPDPNECDYDLPLFKILDDANLLDLWRKTHNMNIEPGYTWSYNVIKKSDGLPFERSDYAWANSPYAAELVKSVDLFATEPITIPEGQLYPSNQLYPSDHYGLVVTLDFKRNF